MVFFFKKLNNKIFNIPIYLIDKNSKMAKSICKLSKLIFQVTENGIITPIFFPQIQPIFFPPIPPIQQFNKKFINITYSQKRNYSDRKIKIKKK